MDFKGAIFDMDGTLLDSMGGWEVLRQRIIVKALGYADDSIPFATSTTNEVIHILKERFGVELKKEAIIEEAAAFLGKFYGEKVELKEGAKAYLEKLHAEEIPMIVATATERRYFGNALSRLEIADFFTDVLTCPEVGRGKHDPLIYNLAAEKMGLKPEKICIFEDSPVAARTGKNAGFLVCGVADESNLFKREELLANSDFFISSYKELL